MALDAQKMAEFGLTDHMTPWLVDGVKIPNELAGYMPFAMPGKLTVPHPNAADFQEAGKQKALLRMWQSFFASRWRSAVGEMRETPAATDTVMPARIGMLSEFGCRLFNHAPAKRERMRFVDHCILQIDAGTYVNGVDVKWICNSSNTGAFALDVRVKPISFTDGSIPADFETAVTKSETYHGTAKIAVTHFEVGSFPIGQFLLIEVDRNLDEELNQLDAIIGIIAARLT